MTARCAWCAIVVAMWSVSVLSAQNAVEEMTLRLQYRAQAAVEEPHYVPLHVAFRIKTNPDVVDLDQVVETVVTDPYGIRYELSTERFRDGNELEGWPWWIRRHVHRSASAVVLGWYDVAFFGEEGEIIATDRVGVFLDRMTVRSGYITSEEKAAYHNTLTLVGIPGRADGVTVTGPFRYIPALAAATGVAIERTSLQGNQEFTVRFSVSDPRVEDGEIVLVDDEGETVAETNYILEDRTRKVRGFTDAVSLSEEGASVTLVLQEDDWHLARNRTLDEATEGYVELRNRRVRLVTRTRAEVAMWSYSANVPITEVR